MNTRTQAALSHMIGRGVLDRGSYCDGVDLNHWLFQCQDKGHSEASVVEVVTNAWGGGHINRPGNQEM